MKRHVATAFAAVLSAGLLLHAPPARAQDAGQPGTRDNSSTSYRGSARSAPGGTAEPAGGQGSRLTDIDRIHDRLFSDRWWERQDPRPRTSTRSSAPVRQAQPWRPAPRETQRPVQLPPWRLRAEARKAAEGETVSPRTLRELRAYNSAARRRRIGAPQGSAALRFLRRSREVLRSQPGPAHRATAPRTLKDPLLGSAPGAPAIAPLLRGTERKPAAPPIDPLLRGTERKPVRKGPSAP